MPNATAVAPVRATKAPTRAKAPPPPPAPPPAPVKPPRAALSADDRLAMAVGDQIFHLIAPIIEGPFTHDTIAGIQYLEEASNHAWDLCSADLEWIEPEPAPTVAQLIPAVQANLHHAMIEMISSTDTSHAAMMHCVRLLVAEALNIANSLLAAYQGLPATHGDLASLTAFMAPVAGARQFRDRPTPPVRRVEDDEAGPVTSDTFTRNAGEKGVSMILQCTYDIDGIADAITTLPEEYGMDGEPALAAVLRCFGTRIAALNSMVMSHLNMDELKLREVQHTLYRDALYLPQGGLQ